MNVDKLAARIDALLPQTQCRQCGFTGCRPYAEAIAAGQAGSDRCAPGGDEGAREIARVMGVPAAPLDPRYGLHKPPAIAAIDESLCVGCTLCIEACPVDAIVGAAKLMHTVIASNCTGCELCLAPCPVDCISLVPTGAPLTRDERRSAAIQARTRYEHRTARRARDAGNRQRSARSPQMKVDPNILRRAIERARRRLAAHGRPEE